MPRRTQSGLAISVDGFSWLLLNCSPDIATQIESFSPLHPRRDRFTPIGGVLLTDANLDHVGGLAVLRQASHRIRVRSSTAVRQIAAAQPSFASFAEPPHRWLELPLERFAPNDGDDDLVGKGLLVRAIALPGATPAYDGRRALPGAVIAYEISEPKCDKTLLYAPVIAHIDDMLAEAIARSEVAFLDGSFYGDAELEAIAGVARSARSMGHQPLGGPAGTLARLAGIPARIVFIHINNSNPILEPTSEASATVRDFGAEIAWDGMELTF